MNQSTIHKLWFYMAVVGMAIVVITSSLMLHVAYGQTRVLKSKAEYLEWAKTRKAYKRVQWFNEQRQNPDGTIPVDIYWAERDRVIQEQRRLGKAASGHLQWETIGPHGVDALPGDWGVTSGRVRGLAVHPQDPNTVYIGAASGGIWKTTDGGESWTPLGDNLESLTFGAIAIDPQSPQTVYAGTGEARFGFNTVIYDGKGLFKSTDGGATWTEITTAFGPQTHFAAIAVDPSNSLVVYAALASGYTFLRSLSNEGIWRSNDGGVTWTQTLPVNDAFDVLPRPGGTGEVFAAIGGGDDDSSGVWFSNDFGVTWTQRNNGLPASSNIARIHLAIPLIKPSTIYAIIFDGAGSTKIFKSKDKGNNWEQIASGIGGQFPLEDPVDQGGYDLCLAVNPVDENEVWAGNVELYHSTDGKTFNVVRRGFGALLAWDSPMHVDYHIIRYAPSDPNIIYVGNDGGVYRSEDGGATWKSLGDGLNTLQFYRIASDPQDANRIIGGAQDNGVIGSKAVTGGARQTWNQLATGDGFDCFFDPTNPNIVYASTQNTNLYKSTNGLDGFNFIGIPTAGLIVNGIPDNERNLRFSTIFFMHPNDPNTLFTATSRVYRSTDGGDNWTALSPPIVGSKSPIQALAISRRDPRRFIAAVGRRVFVSSDGAVTWREVTDNQNFPNITRVVTHPHQDSTLFVVFGGFTNGRSIFISRDFGASWTNITGNLPNVPHNDLFVDPHFENSQVLYVANDLGVYSTTDYGGSWQREGNGMPIVPALDFDYHFGQRLLRVATHGRSVFQASLPWAALAVIHPNGGENFAIGATYTIRWAGGGFSNPQTVRLEYSLDNGATWHVLANGVPNTGSYDWRVPETISPTDQARIRVVNPEDENIMDASNAAFRIFQDPYFRIVNRTPFTTDLGTFTSVAWADYDNDGDLDLSLTSEHPTATPLRIYRNRGGAFTNVDHGIVPSQAFGASWGDFDKDGDLDLMVAGVNNKLLRNLGNGGFIDATDAVFANLPLAVMTSVSWVDFDRDNNLDLFATTGIYDFGTNRKNILFRQNTPGQLVADNFDDNNYDSRNGVWGDFNNDGYPDLFVANHSGQPNVLYKTVKNGPNVDIVTHRVFPAGTNSNAAAWGDYDNDGDLDLFVANDGVNQLYRNNGDETFTLIENTILSTSNVNSKSCAWGDWDNDGHLDLFVGNAGRNFIYRNRGDGSFEAIRLSAVTTVDHFTSSAAWGDFDKDGDLDLLVANGVVGTSTTETNILYRNTSNANGNHWLQVQLHGVVSNLSGIGARVSIYHHGAEPGDLQIREISGLTGTGQNSTIAHFGLGSISTVDSIVVQWPSRRRTVLTNVPADQRLTAFEVENNLFTQSAGGDLFDVRKMNASAWGDINNDGKDDLVLVGGEGNLEVLVNTGHGNFEKRALSFRTRKTDDFTAVTLADCDNDGDLDAFISNARGQNLLLINSGPPHFTFKPISSGSLTDDNENSMAASWADYNNDGLVDLFVANKGTSALYLNNDGRKFKRVSTDDPATEKGVATGCTWVDFDNDGDLDLFVTYADREDVLYRNSGVPDYILRKISAGDLSKDKTASSGASWRDFDLDGDMDVYILKNGRNKLYLNQGNADFSLWTRGDAHLDVADSRSSAWADVGNRGFPTIFVANNGINQLYFATIEKELNKSPVNAATLFSGSYSGVSWGDMDNDGFSDLIVNHTLDRTILYRNSGGNASWLKLTCIGTVSNASAIGTRISVKADLNPKLPGVWQTLDISAQTGTGSQNSLTQIFGLGEATIVDSLVVAWPRSSPMVLTNIPVNQHLFLREPVDVQFSREGLPAIANLSPDATGVSFADIDGDGDEDVFITTLDDKNLLLINDGGSFSLGANRGLAERVTPSLAATWADADNNGTLDVFVANRDAYSRLFSNKEGGFFEEITGGDIGRIRTQATSACWGDYNHDGLVDLFITTSGKGNILLMNKGSLDFSFAENADVFRERTDSRSAVWVDFNNDGLLDLFVVNYNSPNQLFRNRGGGQFIEMDSTIFDLQVAPSVGCSWGDFNNDGWLDLFVANDGERDFLYRNLGNGMFTPVEGTPITAEAGASTGSSWVDFDNDGDLDLLVTTHNNHASLYMNLGNELFVPVTNTKITDMVNGRGHAWADIDNNGTPDLIAAVSQSSQEFFLNMGNRNRWIQLELVGTLSNRAAIGARVQLDAHIDGLPTRQFRQVLAQSGGGTSGQSSLVVHFGLGRRAEVDSVVIFWPSGVRQVVTGLQVNSRHRMEEMLPTTVSEQTEPPATFMLFQNYPNPFNAETNIRFSIPQSEFVVLKLFNVIGQEVMTLLRARKPAGIHTVKFNASHLPSGIYIYRIQAGKFHDSKKLLLLR